MLPASGRWLRPSKEHFGGLDILFVNAGVAELKPVDGWDEAAYDRSFHTNVRGPFFLIQALLPVFGNPASIVFEHLDQCPHSDAEHQRLGRRPRPLAVSGAHAFGRVDFSRNSGERGESGTDCHPALP